MTSDQTTSSVAIPIEGHIIERRGGVAWNLQLADPVARSSRPSWDQRRGHALKTLQCICKERVDHSGGFLTSAEFIKLFTETEVLSLLFQLFDFQCRGLVQQDWFIELLREKLQDDDGQSFTDLLETVAYVIADSKDLDQDLFSRMFTSKGVLVKFYRLIDEGGTGVTAEMLMSYLANLTYSRKNSKLTKDDLRRVEEIFRQRMSRDKRILLEDFKKMIPAKNPFFAERVFEMFDKDGSGGISFTEFMEGVEQYCSKSTEDKVRFIFQVYDLNGDGLIRASELKSVLRACMVENGMTFSEEHLDELTEALYEDANPDGLDGITYEQLRGQMEKHEGLLESLSINIDRWLLPDVHVTKKSSKMGHKLSMSYVKNNIPLVAFIVCYIGVNVALFVTRAIDFVEFSLEDRVVRWDYLYMFARGSGKALHFNSMFILVLMLRRSITFLRGRGVANFLPLDQHVYLHKMVGTVILLLALFHTAMHVSHFAFIVADDWKFHNQSYSLTVWLFTTKPGVFGIIPGTANLTGWAMLFVIAIISLCSLPFVRKSGNFEVFYWTHLLCIPFWALLIMHEAHFWLWLLVPGIIFLIELIIRFQQRLAGKGNSFISTAVLLPSRVTHLIIKKPRHFEFQPGDYVFVNIPAIASFEWHPFTISSAPEQLDSISLHIRGAGGWTNKLYDYFEKQQIRLSQVSIDRRPIKPISLSIVDSPKSSANRNAATPSPPALTPSPKAESSRLLSKSLSCPGAHCELDGKTVRRRRCYTVNDQGELQPVPSSYCHKRKAPVIITISVPEEEDEVSCTRSPPLTPRISFAPETVNRFPSIEIRTQSDGPKRLSSIAEDDGDQTVNADQAIRQPLKVIIDGPYGAPSSHIFHAEHAVLIAAGIGVTPFASILQSIMHRYWNSKQNCPNCRYSWSAEMPQSIRNLKKVDFFWINREQRSFEWFVNLLTQLEIEQAEKSGIMERFLDMHMYITSGLQRTDLKAVSLQLALDLLYNKDKRDLITGLKTRTKAGRPNWDKVFQQLQDQGKGRITVFYCGPPQLGRELSKKCLEFGFKFRKEIF